MRARLFVPAIALLAACTHHHQAKLASGNPPPPAVSMVQHTGRLWIELDQHTAPRQCVVAPAQRKLCFDEVDAALGAALERTLWPSFPRVAVKRRSDDVEPGDYVLLVRVALAALPADADGPGWSARGSGSWQLVRDGLPVAGERLSSRSRAEFAYGRALAQAASEVIDGIAVHIAATVGRLPEVHPESEPQLPKVTASHGSGLLSVRQDGATAAR